MKTWTDRILLSLLGSVVLLVAFLLIGTVDSPLYAYIGQNPVVQGFKMWALDVNVLPAAYVGDLLSLKPAGIHTPSLIAYTIVFLIEGFVIVFALSTIGAILDSASKPRI
jgi:hypothetical protein